jgi:hypothetical protein
MVIPRGLRSMVCPFMAGQTPGSSIELRLFHELSQGSRAIAFTQRLPGFFVVRRSASFDRAVVDVADLQPPAPPDSMENLVPSICHEFHVPPDCWQEAAPVGTDPSSLP